MFSRPVFFPGRQQRHFICILDIIRCGAHLICLIEMQQESTVLAQKLASGNAANGFKKPTNVVEFDDIMQTTKSGTHTSESCLRELSCLPLGGYSVMSIFPAVNVSAPVVKPVVVAMTSMDSATFFRDVAPGADSPMSGLTSISVVWVIIFEKLLR